MSACPLIAGAVYTLRDAFERGPQVAHCHETDLLRLEAAPVDAALTTGRIALATNMAVNDLLVYAHVIPRLEPLQMLMRRGLTLTRLDELEGGLEAFRDELLIQRFEAKTRPGDFRDVFAENLRASSQNRLDMLAAMLRSARAYLLKTDELHARAAGCALGMYLQAHPSETALSWMDTLVKYPEVPDA